MFTIPKRVKGHCVRCFILYDRVNSKQHSRLSEYSIEKNKLTNNKMAYKSALVLLGRWF